MQYDRNNAPRAYELNDPPRPDTVHKRDGQSYDGPHWGWFVGVAALLLLGLIAIGSGDSNTTLMASNDSSPAAAGTTPARP